MYLLISDDKKFTQIIPVTNDTFRLECEPFTDTDFMLWRSDADICPFSVGDSIPFNSMFGLYIVKRFGTLLEPSERVKYKDNQAEEFELVKFMLEKLTQEKIDAVKTKLQEITSDDEVFYRVFYNSFKMYRLRDKCFQISQLLKHLVGDDLIDFDEKTYAKSIDLSNFDKTLQLSLNKVFHSVFTMDQNDSNRWADDARTLVGTYQMLVQALDYLIRFSQDLLNKKGFIFEQSGFGINWHEAGAMEVYLPLNNFRNSNHDKLKSYLGL